MVSVEAAPIYVVVGDILLRGRRATIVKLSSRASVVEVWLCASERACGETATLQLRPAEGHTGASWSWAKAPSPPPPVAPQRH